MLYWDFPVILPDRLSKGYYFPFMDKETVVRHLAQSHTVTKEGCRTQVLRVKLLYQSPCAKELGAAWRSRYRNLNLWFLEYFTALTTKSTEEGIYGAAQGRRQITQLGLKHYNPISTWGFAALVKEHLAGKLG